MTTPGRGRGGGSKESARLRRKCNAIRKRNAETDERDIRLDLLRSLRIQLPQVVREDWLVQVREKVRQGQISRVVARELRALFGGADYA